MPIYPPRNEPIRKIEVLEKREMELVKCLRTNSSEEKTNNKAEKVREAQLNLIKAKLALIQPYKVQDKGERTERLRPKLEKQTISWKDKSTESIIDEYKE